MQHRSNVSIHLVYNTLIIKHRMSERRKYRSKPFIATTKTIDQLELAKYTIALI